MRWAQKQRLNFISERLRTARYINRADIMREFGISTCQASNDLRVYREASEGRVRYNPNSKRYEAVGSV